MNNEQTEFRGNKQLKAPNVSEFVDASTFNERLEEIKKISDDIAYFAENYFYIISLDNGKSLIKLYPKQAELIKTMANERRTICVAARQCGKCLCADAQISVRNKKTKEIEQITIGEFFKRIKNR
jgi:hypothetical protein